MMAKMTARMEPRPPIQMIDSTSEAMARPLYLAEGRPGW
jgi:hypothetical protein